MHEHDNLRGPRDDAPLPPDPITWKALLALALLCGTVIAVVWMLTA